jgi:hypothetical protein
MKYNLYLRFSTASIFLITNILVSKVSLLCSFHSFLQSRTICLFDGLYIRIDHTAVFTKYLAGTHSQTQYINH